MKNRIVSMLLAVMLMLGMFACASAETAASEINLLDMYITVGNNTFNLPMPASELTEMGISLPELTVNEGEYLPFVDAHDGRNAFSLRFDYCSATPDDPWASGCYMDAEKFPGIIISGMILGETTLGEVIDAMGPDTYGKTNEESLTYYFRSVNDSWNLTFDGPNRGNKLIKVHMWTDVAAEYGPVETVTVTEELPDPFSMPYNQVIIGGNAYQEGDTVQKFLDNGWVLPLAEGPDTEIAAREGNKVHGGHYLLYNGEAVVKIWAYNTGDAAEALKNCVIDAIEVEYDYGTVMTAADGIQPGVSTYKEVVAAYGEPVDSYEKDTEVEYTFKLLNGAVRYIVTVNKANTVTAVQIDGLM